jgi:hypothetical protein
MALIPIYCSNESCKHLGFVSVETLPRVLTCSSCGLQSLHAPPPQRHERLPICHRQLPRRVAGVLGCRITPKRRAAFSNVAIDAVGDVQHHSRENALQRAITAFNSQKHAFSKASSPTPP